MCYYGCGPSGRSRNSKRIVRGCFEMQNSENCDRRRSLSQTMKDGRLHSDGALREQRPAAEQNRRVREARGPQEQGERRGHPALGFLGRTIVTLVCLGIMAGSLVAVGAVYYVVQATASDGDLLNLDNIELSQSSLVVATDPTPAHRWSTPPCAPPTATASGRTSSRSPPTYSMHSSAPRTKTFTASRASTSSAPSAR